MCRAPPSGPPPAPPSGPPPEPEVEEDELEILKDYDIVILVDDSRSMKEPLWSQTRSALAKLAETIFKYNKTGIDINFLNNKTVGKRLKTKSEVDQLFGKVTPSGPTPIANALEDVTHSLLRNIEKENPHNKTNYLVITDGRPTDDVEGVIVHISNRLDKAGATLSQLGIQFIQIGTDSNATSFLVKLDNDLKRVHKIRDMVDTEPYIATEVTTARLIKFLLGGINRRIDNSS